MIEDVFRSELMTLVRLALREDLGHGDVTTALTVGRDDLGAAAVVARRDLVLSGLDLALAAFREAGPELELSPGHDDGDRVPPGGVILTVRGRSAAILTAERVALNFLGRLSGVATLTDKFVALANEGARKAGVAPPRILDTRKTTPGLRFWEKRAVVHGGGANHRFCLSDGILVKDNHIRAAGSLAEALRRARDNGPHNLKIEVEVDDLGQLAQALEFRPDTVLLDNMDPPTLRRAMGLIRDFHAPGPRLTKAEASGGVSLATVSEVAAAGVDYVSAGALTHSAPSADVGLDWL